MKYLLLLLLALFAGQAARAQTLLTKSNGDEVAVILMEVTPAEVKYKRADNPDGPLVVMRRVDVFMIRYADGTKEVLNPPAWAGGTGPAPVAGAGAAATAPVGPGDEPKPFDNIHLDGPRLGFTVLTDGVLSRARRDVEDLSPFLTQFGWQFETRLFRMPNGLTALAEFVPLVGGVEQGKFIPSISGLLGLRGPKGFEFGLGPNLTPLGANLVLAVGTSFHSNGINFPVNLAVVPGNGGARISLLFGFNARKY